MEIGIGLPNAVRGVDRQGIVDWARRAEEAGFSSLGTIDRIVYSNYESLIALAAAAAVTERIRLVTDILLAPLRTNTALFAKQAASVDALSEGRLVLGLAPGGREDDYRASSADFHARGKAFDAQLEQLAELWSGNGGVGPAPADGRRPRLLIGGASVPSFRRAAAHGDGWTQGGGTPEAFAEGLAAVQRAWADAGRDGRPYAVALIYFALGDDDDRGRENLLDYYAWLGEYAAGVADSAARDQQTLKSYIAAFEEAGADELICFPALSDPDQVELLAQAVL